MRTFTDKEFTLFEKLCCMTEEKLFRAVKQILLNYYGNEKVFMYDKNYIVACGDIPVALVAHLDTVFDEPPREVFYDIRKGVCWSPDGLGADDRAGVFAILNIIQRGLRPHVIFTMGEEVGGIGAQALAENYLFKELLYMIELDRQGENDMVFYQCYCPAFISYVGKFGFLEKLGSYSDISFLMDKWRTCGVNLSIGYKDEHSYGELLYVDAMFATINKVIEMLKDVEVSRIAKFAYATNGLPLTNWYKTHDTHNDVAFGQCKCGLCGEDAFDFETLNYEGHKICYDCFEKLELEGKI